MNTTTISLELPTNLYINLQQLAEQEHIDMTELLSSMVILWTNQPRTWQEGWRVLREQIAQDGGLKNVGTTTEEIIERMRQTRQEIYDEEYAHLYR